MGLLDEAIREHLELKRRQGADPGEIARKEREALAPVVPDEPTSWGADPIAPAHDLDETADAFPGEVAEQPTGEPDFSTMGQETAELDMQAVLDAADGAFEPSATASPAAAGVAPVRAAHAEQMPREDPRDWEEPREGVDAEHAVQEIPGQERLSFE